MHDSGLAYAASESRLRGPRGPGARSARGPRSVDTRPTFANESRIKREKGLLRKPRPAPALKIGFPYANGSRIRQRPTYHAHPILKSFPLKRRPGAGRDGVGHRRWARQRTPARSRATECRYTGTFRLRVPGTAASRRRDFAFPSPFALPDEGARGESFPPAGSGAEPLCLSGVRGGPACLSCVSSLPAFPLFLLFQGLDRRGDLLPYGRV